MIYDMFDVTFVFLFSVGSICMLPPHPLVLISLHTFTGDRILERVLI